MELKILIEQLQKNDISNLINQRLNEFKELGKKENDYWFSELCFCLLTANSKAKTAIIIQKELGPKGFLELTQEQIGQSIRKNKHRFYLNKSKYIVKARENKNIKKLVKEKMKELGENNCRNYLAEKILGLGYKEASHFLRNVGYKNVAILDRHILRLLKEQNYIPEIPKTLTKKKYLQIEEIFQNLAVQLNMNCAELDLYMWYIKTGEVLK